MPLFEWSESYCLGIAHIDAQHKQLCSLTNELHDAMAQGKGKTILGKALEELVRYTVKHFNAEEDLMAARGCPDLPQHRAIHNEFRHAVEDFQKDFRAGSLSLSIAMMEFLSHWLLTHIQQTDRRSLATVHPMTVQLTTANALCEGKRKERAQGTGQSHY